MPDQDKILYFLKVVGPTIPAKVAKNINTEIMLASAHLSDLATQGKVKISNLKIGGTPLYYLPGQEEQLYHFAAGNLNPKDFQVLQVLKEQKILRENSLDLLSKVALRSLKDFAIPLQVTVSGNRELFWKWHLLNDADASAAIKQMLFVPEVPAASAEETQPSLPEALTQFSSAQEEQEQNYEEDDSNSVFQPSKEPAKEELYEKIEKVLSKPKAKRGRKPKAAADPEKTAFDDFLPSTEQFLTQKEIVIQEKEIIRKNAEANLLIKVPSAVGSVTYFCKAKKKAKCDEGDVSAAYMEAQIKKLPLLFIYSHELTKKAQEMLATDAFQNALVAKLEKINEEEN